VSPREFDATLPSICEGTVALTSVTASAVALLP
jgi:hypothetical protein